MNYKEIYQEERENAISSLINYTRSFRNTLDKWAPYKGFVDEETAHCLQAYTAAEMALLTLMKEESEVSNDE